MREFVLMQLRLRQSGAQTIPPDQLEALAARFCTPEEIQAAGGDVT